MRIYRRHLTWWIAYQKGGRLVRRSLGTHDRAVAEGTLAAMRAARTGLVGRSAVEAMLDDIYGTPRARDPRIRLQDAQGAYDSAASAAGLDSVGEDTSRKRRYALAAFVRWAGEAMPAVDTVEAVTGPVAAAYAAKLRTDGLKDKSRRNSLGYLSTVWTVLSKVSSGLRNPWTGLMPRVRDADERLPFTPDEERRVLAAAADAGHGWLLACLVARHTGMRYGDVAELRRDEVHLDGGFIRYRPRKTRRHGVWVTVPIEEGALGPAIAEALAAPARDDMDEFVLREHAWHYRQRGHSKMPVQFSDVLRAAGVDASSHTFHSWRHTLNTRMADAGVDIETRMRVSGHRTREMSRHYDHSDHLPETRAAIAAAAGDQNASRGRK